MIKELCLKDFKCFAELNSIQLRPITLLTGSNGRGKSSLFQSLLLLAQSFRSGRNLDVLRVNGRFVNLGTYQDILFRGSKKQTIEMGITTDDADENRIDLEWGEDEKKPKSAALMSFRVKYNSGETRELVTTLGADNESSNNGVKSVGSNSAVAALNQFSNFYYIAADRLGPVNYGVQSDDYGMGVHGEQIVNVLNEKGEEFIKEVSSEISKVMGGAYISVDEIDREFLKLTMDSKDGEEGYKPVNVGFGYSYLMPVIVTPLVAQNNAKIVIENPEAHLHPGAQSRLMYFLVKVAKKKNLQLFVETHSDHIINALRIATKDQFEGLLPSDSCIIHLWRTKDSIPFCTSIFIDKEGSLSDYPCDFMEEWGNQMMQLV